MVFLKPRGTAEGELLNNNRCAAGIDNYSTISGRPTTPVSPVSPDRRRRRERRSTADVIASNCRLEYLFLPNTPLRRSSHGRGDDGDIAIGNRRKRNFALRKPQYAAGEIFYNKSISAL